MSHYVNYGIDRDADPHRHNHEVHYRLYHHPDKGPTVICVQAYDYADYDERRIMTGTAYDSEYAAEDALQNLIFVTHDPTSGEYRTYKIVPA